MQSSFILEIIVREHTTVLNLLTGNDQALLSTRDTFSLLHSGFDGVSRVVGPNVERDGPPSKSPHKELYFRGLDGVSTDFGRARGPRWPGSREGPLQSVVLLLMLLSKVVLCRERDSWLWLNRITGGLDSFITGPGGLDGVSTDFGRARVPRCSWPREGPLQSVVSLLAL